MKTFMSYSKYLVYGFRLLEKMIVPGFIQKTRHKNQVLFKDFQAPNYIFFQNHYIIIERDLNTTPHNLE